MQREYRYEYLYPDEFEKIKNTTPICYVPVGSMEWHDMHAPFGTDSFIAHELAMRLVHETGGIVLPVFSWAVHCSNDVELPCLYENAKGSIALRKPELWENFIRAQVEAILKTGKWHIVFVPGHVGGAERDALARIADDVTAEGDVAAVFLYIYQYTIGDHAGRYETSVLLGLKPDVVRDAPSCGNPWARESKDLSTIEEGKAKVNDIVSKSLEIIRSAIGDFSE